MRNFATYASISDTNSTSRLEAKLLPTYLSGGQTSFSFSLQYYDKQVVMILKS